jgi:branched-chain amino acid transport system substrate-binding protein
MMKRVAGVFALVLGLSTIPVTSGAQATNSPYEINAVLSLTGGAAVIGTHEAQSLSIAEKLINRDGGIQGRPVKFVVQDDTSNPQVSVQLMNGLIAKGAPVVIGSGVVAMCNAMLTLAEKSGPLTYCLSPIVNLTAGSYMFGASTGTKDIIQYTLRLLRSRHLTRVALITATDASVQTYDSGFVAGVAGADGAGLEIVDKEQFNVTDLSMTAQLARIKSASPQVIVTYCTGPSFGTLLRSINDSGVTVPVFGSGGNLSYAQLQPYGTFAPKELYLTGSNGLVPDPGATGPYKAAQTRFFNAYKEAGIRVEYLDTIAWDPAMMLVDAIRNLGPSATAAQIRTYLQSLRGWAGVEGRYDFRTYPQRGLGVEAVAAYQWVATDSTVRPVPAFRMP